MSRSKNMDIEEIVQKLENCELPEIEIERHRVWLRQALLDTGVLKRQPDVSFPESVRILYANVSDLMSRWLLSRQPVWKMALVGAFTLVVVVIASLMLPKYSTDSVYARAMNIVKNSPEIQAVTGNTTLKDIQVLVDDDNRVILRFTSGLILFTAEINLESGKVLYVSTCPELTEEERQTAIDIAEADSRIMELFRDGATILRCRGGFDYATNKEIAVMVIEHNHNVWFVYIDLDNNSIPRISKLE